MLEAPCAPHALVKQQLACTCLGPRLSQRQCPHGFTVYHAPVRIKQLQSVIKLRVMVQAEVQHDE